MAAVYASEAVQSVSAVARIENANHQLRWLILDYGKDVKMPEPAAYCVRDYGTASIREKFHQYPYSDAPIVKVSVSDEPDPAAARDSGCGRYVILELAVIRGVVKDGDMVRPPFNAGICTWRQKDDRVEWRRNDFSDLSIFQTLPVEYADGTVVRASALPELKAENICTPEIERFREGDIDRWNGEPIFVSYHIPEEIAAGQAGEKKYPMVLSLSGAGGMHAVENGHDSAGGHFTRDRAACAWLEAEEPVIVLNPQIPRISPRDEEEKLMRLLDHIMDLVKEFIDSYPVDPDRVYCIGSSFGTMCLSRILAQEKYTKTFAAYLMCNGMFTGAETMFKEEYDQRASEHILAPLTKNYTDFSDPQLFLHGDKFFESEDFAQMAKVMQPIVDARVVMEIWHGVNDQVLPASRGISTYLMMKELYRRQGLSDEQIAQVLRLYMIPTEEFHRLGIFSYHQASKVTVSYPETLKRILQIRRGQQG